MTRLAGLALALSVLVGCARSSVVPHVAPASAVPGATTVGMGPLSAARVREIGRAVTELRRLVYLRDVPVSFVDAASFEARVVENLASQSTDSIVGMFSDESPTESYRAKAKFLLAVYSPSKRAIFVRRTLPEGWTGLDLETLLAHELVHALQYQHFAPDELFDARRKSLDLDATAAMNAFLEGEAELVAAGFAARRQGGPPRRAMVEVGRDRTLDSHLFAVVGNVNSALAKASSTDQANQLFPYQFGPFFAAALYRTGGPELLDRTWASPPATTREIFDPALYLQAAQKLELAPLPLPAGHEPVLSVTLGSNGFYRLAALQAKGGSKPGEEWPPPPTPAALLDLSTHVVADRFTFTKGLFGGRPLLVCWVFDSVDRARQAQALFPSSSTWVVGDRLVFAEGVPRKLLVGLPEQYATVKLTAHSHGGRPAPRVLGPLPGNGSTMLQDARTSPDPVSASAAVAGGFRLRDRASDAVLGPGEAWLASHRRDGITTFLSLLGDGIHDSNDLLGAFEKGLVLDKKNVTRKTLSSIEYAKYTFVRERMEWPGGSVLVMHAPACDGVSRVLITFVPAPTDDRAALDDVRGLDGLRSSPYCAKVRDQHAHDLP